MTAEEKTLIEELHGFAGGGASAPSSLMRDAADALGRAIEERDVLREAVSKEAQAMARASAETAAAFGALHVEIGTTMAKLGYEGLRQQLAKTEAERDDALATIEKVREQAEVGEDETLGKWAYRSRLMVINRDILPESPSPASECSCRSEYVTALDLVDGCKCGRLKPFDQMTDSEVNVAASPAPMEVTEEMVKAATRVIRSVYGEQVADTGAVARAALSAALTKGEPDGRNAE